MEREAAVLEQYVQTVPASTKLLTALLQNKFAVLIAMITTSRQMFRVQTVLNI